MMLNDVRRIKLSFYLVIVLLFSLLVQFYPQQVYASDSSLKGEYEQYGDSIRFDENRQILRFVTKTKVAPNNNVTRFTTIGWQVRFEPNDGSPKFYTRVPDHHVDEYRTGGNVYTLYAIPLSDSQNQQFANSVIDCLARDFEDEGYDVDYFATKFANRATIRFDAIISIKEPGYTVTNAIFEKATGKVKPNSQAPSTNRGEYYLTEYGSSYVNSHKIRSDFEHRTSWDKNKGGITGARGWSGNEFDDYFNKPISVKLENVIVQKTVKATHWTTDGQCLDPGGKPQIMGLYDIKVGETKNVSVTGLSFPEYRLVKSALNYTGKSTDNFDYVEGDAAKTRTIQVSPKRENHYVYFYYERINPEDGIPYGSIIFNPVQSSDISGNRDGWVNQDINVKVTVEPSKEEVVMKNGSESRSYQYYDSGKWVNDSADCSFQQTWKATQLKVQGAGKTANGQSVNIGPFTIANGGTITINKELKNVYLTATVVKWEPQNDQSFTCGSPPRGSWTQSSPSGNTPQPTEVYYSTSGLYFLDKTKPKVDSFSPTSAGWTNQTVIPIKVSDNLSGFYRNNSYVEAIDKSYYGHSKPKDYFDNGALTGNKTVSLTQDGIYQIKVNLEDIAKNKMNEVIEYKVDKTKPYDAQFSYDYRNYIDENLKVTVTVGDNLSGVVETKYVLNNSPNDNSGMRSIPVQTTDGYKDYNTFTVDITEPGSWWIHVYQKDRAGNVTETTSPEYKIVRLGHADNRYGQTFSGQDDEFWISPLQTNDKIPRATRFDMLLETYGLTEQEATITTVHMKVPRWVDDAVEKKVGGNYAITSGTTSAHTMNYYSGYAQNAHSYGNPSTKLQWWKAFIPPYGTPVSLDADGNRLRPKYEIEVYLKFDGYNPSKTHTSILQFDVVPETKIETEIIQNEY